MKKVLFITAVVLAGCTSHNITVNHRFDEFSNTDGINFIKEMRHNLPANHYEVSQGWCIPIDYYGEGCQYYWFAWQDKDDLRLTFNRPLDEEQLKEIRKLSINTEEWQTIVGKKVVINDKIIANKSHCDYLTIIVPLGDQSAEHVLQKVWQALKDHKDIADYK